MSSPVEEIKSRLDIVNVVGAYVKLQKAGVNLRARCPFHSEKTPSFFVSPARQSWHCFGGCSVGGDIFKFVMKIEGMEFGEALRLLAQKAGVELTKYEGRGERIAHTQRSRLQELLELATQFFEAQLASSQKGKEVKAYLLQRGMTEESMTKWRIGYAPGNKTALIDFLRARGYAPGEVSRAGLTVQSEGKLYDRFRSRIMFPVCDLHAQVIGFGGRVFGERETDELAKYVNVPNTPLYDKSRVLYGLDKARVEVRRADACVLVEGYMDVIMVSQAGFENVVASSGTALTPLQLKTLKRYTDNLFLAFDMDKAGDAATKRGISLAVEEGFGVKVVLMPQGKDPADVASQSPAFWQELLSKAGSIMDFYFTSAFKERAAPEEKRKAAQSEFLSILKRISNKIEQSYWIQKLAKELQVSEQSVLEELKKVPFERESSKGVSFAESAKDTPLQKTRQELLEERLLTLIFRNPQLLSEIGEERLAVLPVSTQEVITGLVRIYPASFELQELEKVFSSQTLEYLQYLILKAEMEEEGPPAGGDSELEFRSCLLELELLDVRRKMDILASAIRKAEEEKDNERLEGLLREFRDLTKSLQ